MRSLRRAALLAVLALVLPTAALAASAGQPFPSNRYSTPDATQATGLRVDLAKPNCAVRPSDCADIDVLNTLDGFNIQPRISVPFSGPIDLATATSDNIFLVGPGYHVVGINQVVWEPAANTLHFESDQQLDQSSTYLLVVTNGVHDADGAPLDTTTFRHDLNFGQTKDPALKAYRKALLDGLSMARAVGAQSDDIAAASLFTTQTHHRDLGEDPRADPGVVAGAGVVQPRHCGERTVFPLSSLASIPLAPPDGHRDVRTPPSSDGSAAASSPARSRPIAFGSYSSPDYENASKFIPAYRTAPARPCRTRRTRSASTLFLPSGAKPADGWPVAIFGHGFGDSQNGAPWAVASSLAQAGIATVAINVVGHGGGPAGHVTVLPHGAGAP